MGLLKQTDRPGTGNWKVVIILYSLFVGTQTTGYNS
jgi:hypothetical protein